jgi:hypothetical protein
MVGFREYDERRALHRTAEFWSISTFNIWASRVRVCAMLLNRLNTKHAMQLSFRDRVGFAAKRLYRIAQGFNPG